MAGCNHRKLGGHCAPAGSGAHPGRPSMERSVKARLPFAIVALVVGVMPAEAYPDKPITLVIPFPSGGSTGYTAKVLAEHMAKALGQPVNVEAKTGNFGINAIKEIAGKTDGYTLMVGSIITNSMT